MEHESCEFRLDYPPRHHHLGPGCQFKDETTFFDCNGKQFCRFHLPMAHESGQPTEKTLWQATGSHGLEIDAFDQMVAATIEAALVPGEIANFVGVVFPLGITLESYLIPESIWYGACFQGYANFAKAKFWGDAYFSYTNFLREAYFRRASFRGAANFMTAEFHSDADFWHSKFSDNTIFINTTFHDFAAFGFARFEQGAGFFKAEFLGETNFMRAEFLHSTTFKEAKFKGRAEGLENTSFRDAVFYEETEFTDSEFQIFADFTNAKFRGSIDFTHARQHKEKWSDTIGSRRGNKTPAPAIDSTEDSRSLGESFQKLDFTGVVVEGKTDFTNRVFNEPADFGGCRFETAPKFGGCQLHEDTGWAEAKFLDRGSEHAPDAYRILRFAMERTRNRHQEGVFFALEQESKRNNMKQKSLDWWLSLAYEITAGYGRSLSRPLASLVVTTLLFCFLYGYPYWLSEGQLPTPSKAASFIQPAIEQVVRPFAVWVKPSPGVEDLFDNALLTFQLLAALQSILSLAFIALFILALRWHFKRG